MRIRRSYAYVGPKASLFRAVVVSCVLALTLTACSSSPEGASPEGTEAEPDPDSSPSAQVGGEDGEEGPTTLTIAIGAEPRTMDLLTAEDGQRDLFQFSVYETLTWRSGESLELEPKLAESWEVDGPIWTFQLRPDITFHDGSSFDAEDVVASFARLQSEGSELAGSRAGGIVDVRVVDELTVEIETEAPDPTLPAKTSLVGIAPSDLASAGDDSMASTMVGTGPYQFETWNRGENLVLTRFDDYWGDQPEVSDVTIEFLEEDSTRLAALEAGELDIALKMPPEFENRAENVISGPSPDVYTVFFNTVGGGALEDVTLRRAVNHAIDRQAIIDQLLGGYGETVHGQYVGQYVFGTTPELEEFEYNPDEARRLVEEVGGSPALTLSATTGRWVKDREIAEAIGGMLEEVGITVEVQLPEFSQWLDGLFAEAADAPDMWLAGHGNELFDMERSTVWVTCDGALSHYCREEVDEVVTEASRELDQDRRLDLYRQMWEMVHTEDAAYASLSTIEQLHFAAPHITWQPRPDNFVLIQEIRTNS